ncbi:MAG: hypothetical protein KAS58_07775 [Calditrichia bacterium]|nr:hypothetical protein [Calditrichia bacterium]
MDENLVRQVHVRFLSLILIIITANISFAQLGLQIPVYNLDTHSDSTRVSFPKTVLPLRNWQDSADQYFEIKHESKKLDINQYISPNIIPKDPFKLDMRGSSYYVPRMVRDELNLIMNRPRENAFVPILPVAFLALQLASEYLLIQLKTEITSQDIENGQEGLPVLEELWKKNPQTMTELYKKERLKDKYTMLELQRLLEILADNKLVKRKLIENSETQFFYALGKNQYHQIIERGKAEKFNSQRDHNPQSVEINPTIK